MLFFAWGLLAGWGASTLYVWRVCVNPAHTERLSWDSVRVLDVGDMGEAIQGWTEVERLMTCEMNAVLPSVKVG